jgi:hypothetical protein
VEQYHDKNGHMGINETFEAIRNKYFWPNMSKEIYAGNRDKKSATTFFVPGMYSMVQL